MNSNIKMIWDVAKKVKLTTWLLPIGLTLGSVAVGMGWHAWSKHNERLIQLGRDQRTADASLFIIPFWEKRAPMLARRDSIVKEHDDVIAQTRSHVQSTRAAIAAVPDSIPQRSYEVRFALAQATALSNDFDRMSTLQVTEREITHKIEVNADSMMLHMAAVISDQADTILAVRKESDEKVSKGKVRAIIGGTVAVTVTVLKVVVPAIQKVIKHE